MKKTWGGNPAELRQWPEGLWNLVGHTGEAGLHQIYVMAGGAIDLAHNGQLAVEAAGDAEITRCCHPGEYNQNEVDWEF